MLRRFFFYFNCKIKVFITLMNIDPLIMLIIPKNYNLDKPNYLKKILEISLPPYYSKFCCTIHLYDLFINLMLYFLDIWSYHFCAKLKLA